MSLFQHRLGPWLALLIATLLSACNYESGQLALDRGDAQKAAEIWQPLAEIGDTRSALALGRLILDGEPTAEDLDAAKQHLDLITRRGAPWQRGWAEYDLGRIALLQGDPARAATRFEAALYYDIPWAAHGLAGLLINGDGVARDVERAVDLFTRAAAEDIAPAMTALGDHYATRTPPDAEQAHFWYDKVAGRDPWADYGLGRLFATELAAGVADADRALSDRNIDPHEALERAAAAGLEPAQRLLGDLLLPLDARYADKVSSDPERAVSLYRQAAEGGDIWAHLRLGNILRDGDIVVRDPAAAARHYAIAAEADISGAHAALARLFEFGDGVTPDRDRAIRHYRRAVELGEAGVQQALDLLLQGDTPQGPEEVDNTTPRSDDRLQQAAAAGDVNAAFELAQRLTGDDSADRSDIRDYYQQAAEGGVAAAWKPLADMIREGRGGAEDPAGAAGFYQRAAEAGDRWADFELAKLHIAGGWPDADPARAVAALERLAEGGMAEAAKLLGDLYDRGDGVDADPSAALIWHERAAEIGHREVLLDLARRHERGLGTPRDHRQALSYYSQAAESGMVAAQRWLADHHANAADGDIGEAAARSLATAHEWYRAAAFQGDPWSLYRLGHYTLQGKGVDRDAARAMSLLEEAAEAGSRPAAMTLGDLYTVGGPVDPDPQQAAHWYQRAVQSNTGSQ